MGVNTYVNSNCLAGTNNQKHLIVDGRLQEFASTKELIRQLPFTIENDIVSNREWLFQRTLTGTSPNAIFPVGPTSQFYTPTSGSLATLDKDLNSTEGYDLSALSNVAQPNFVFIASDSPIAVTFGYAPDDSIWRDPNDLTKSLYPTTVVTSTPTVQTTNATIKAIVGSSGDITGFTVVNGGAGYPIDTTQITVTVAGTDMLVAERTITIAASASDPTVGTITDISVVGGSWGSSYYCAPANVNQHVLINGYYINNLFGYTSKIAPATVADLTAWYPDPTVDPTYTISTWNAAQGTSIGSITFPIYVEKADSVSNARVLIYCAKLNQA